MNTNALTYAAGAILLGVVGICFHDFAMQWQPVPAGIGMRTQLAYLARCVLAIGGALLLVPRVERAGALLLTVFIGLWVLVLNLPPAIASASHIGAWNSPAEITFLTSGGSRAVRARHHGQLARDTAEGRATAGGGERHRVRLCAFQLHRFHRRNGPRLDSLQDVLGLGHRSRASRDGTRAGQRLQGPSGRRLRGGHDGFVRGAAASAAGHRCAGSTRRMDHAGSLQHAHRRRLLVRKYATIEA